MIRSRERESPNEHSRANDSTPGLSHWRNMIVMELKEDGSDRARAGADCGARGPVIGWLWISVRSGVERGLGVGVLGVLG